MSHYITPLFTTGNPFFNKFTQSEYNEGYPLGVRNPRKNDFYLYRRTRLKKNNNQSTAELGGFPLPGRRKYKIGF